MKEKTAQGISEEKRNVLEINVKTVGYFFFDTRSRFYKEAKTRKQFLAFRARFLFRSRRSREKRFEISGPQADSDHPGNRYLTKNTRFLRQNVTKSDRSRGRRKVVHEVS